MEAGQLGGQGQTIDNLHILSVNNDSDKCRRLSGGSDNVKCEVVDFVLNVIVTEAEYSEDLVAAVQEDTNKEEDENLASELVTRMAEKGEKTLQDKKDKERWKDGENRYTDRDNRLAERERS